MDFVKRSKWFILLGFGIVLLYFFLRLINLSYLPIFTDEAIYTRWAQIALNDANWRFISLTDGKQPMFTWFAMVFMKLIDDPLVAGRVVSVVCGFFTLIGLWFLTLELFKNKKIAYLSALLYVCYPFAQVYDRMALQDSMVATFYVWATYFTVLLVRHIRLDIAYTLGVIIGGGILAKSTNFLSIYLLPFSLLLFDWKKERKIHRLFRLGILFGVSIMIAYAMYAILRLSPFFAMIDLKTATFVYPLSEWLQHPFMNVIGNWNGLSDWFMSYVKPTYLFLMFLSFIFFKKYLKEKLFLLIYFAAPFILLVFFGRTIFPRYIFFMSIPLLSLAAVGLLGLIEWTKKRTVKYLSKTSTFLMEGLIVILFISYSLFVSLQFAYAPTEASIARADSDQYVNSWPAGWGVKESVLFLENESKNKKIFVATEGTFGLMPASLELYLWKNKNIIVKGYWPFNEFLPQEALDYAKKMPSYFIFYQPEHAIISPNYPLELIFQKKAGKSKNYYRVYKIVPSK